MRVELIPWSLDEVIPDLPLYMLFWGWRLELYVSFEVSYTWWGGMRVLDRPIVGHFTSFFVSASLS